MTVFPDTPHCADVTANHPCQILQTYFHSTPISDYGGCPGELGFICHGGLSGRKILLSGLYTAQIINDQQLEKLCAEDIAAYMSLHYLSKLFHGRLKIGIAAYLSSVPVSHAIPYKYTAPDYPLTALVLDMGFSTSAFSRALREKWAYLPNDIFP